jgi:hypothetical protein
MANYYEYSIADVTDPDCVGIGTGKGPDGSCRICVSMEGKPVNPELDSSWHEVGWKALTPACARSLYAQLTMLRHLFEQDAEAEPLVHYLVDGYAGAISVPRGPTTVGGGAVCTRPVVVLDSKPRRRAVLENLSESAHLVLTLVDTGRTITLAPRAIVAVPEDYAGAVEAHRIEPPPLPDPPANEIETDERGEFQS